jgi:hypothetical protein
MLHVVVLAYHGQAVPALDKQGRTEDRGKLLWQAYVNRMFEQRPLSIGTHYSPAQAISWMTHLAKYMQVEHQTEFYLDRLTPISLPAPSGRRHIFVKVMLIIADLINPTIFMPDFWEEGEVHELDDIAKGLNTIIVLLPSLTAAIAIGLFVGLTSGPIIGFVSALSIALGTAVITVLFCRTRLGGESRIVETNPIGRTSGWPNEATWRSAIHGLFSGTAAVVAYGIVSMVGLNLYLGRHEALASGLIVAVLFGASWLIMGGGVKFFAHFQMRYFIMRAGVGPWRYTVFLDEMSQRLFLQPAGASYMFVHRLLRDYFGDMSPVQRRFILDIDDYND